MELLYVSEKERNNTTREDTRGSGGINNYNKGVIEQGSKSRQAINKQIKSKVTEKVITGSSSKVANEKRKSFKTQGRYKF